MREEGKPQGEGTSKKNQKGSQVRNEGALSVAPQGRLCNTRGGVWWSSNFTESKKTSLFTPQGRMEIALFMPATFTLAYGMPSVMNRGAEPLDYLEVLHYFTFLPHLMLFFFLFPLTSKTDQSPSSCSCLPRPSTFVPIICKPRCQINTIIFFNLLKCTLSKECVYLVINSTYIGVPTTLRMF